MSQRTSFRDTYQYLLAGLTVVLLTATNASVPVSAAEDLVPYYEDDRARNFVHKSDIRLVTRGKSLVYVITTGMLKKPSADGALYFQRGRLFECNHPYLSFDILNRTFASDGVPLVRKEPKGLGIAIDDAIRALNAPPVGSMDLDEWKRLCAVIGRWLHENAYDKELETLIDQQPSARDYSIPLELTGGVYTVRATINSSLALTFVVDSGATDLTLPSFIGKALSASSSLTEADIVGTAAYTLADGSTQRGTVVKLRSLRIGPIELRDVRAVVMPSDSTAMLLGQSVLQRLGSWRLDAASRRLVIEP